MLFVYTALPDPECFIMKSVLSLATPSRTWSGVWFLIVSYSVGGWRNEWLPCRKHLHSSWDNAGGLSHYSAAFMGFITCPAGSLYRASFCAIQPRQHEEPRPYKVHMNPRTLIAPLPIHILQVSASLGHWKLGDHPGSTRSSTPTLSSSFSQTILASCFTESRSFLCLKPNCKVHKSPRPLICKNN